MKNLFVTLFIIVFVVSCGTENNPTYTLTTTVSPSEGGTITPSSGEFSEGEVVELTGTPTSNGWRFIRWEGDWNVITNPTSITINKNYNIIGVFERKNYSLNITIEGDGRVEERVVQQKSSEYPYQTVVELTPIPSEGWRFVEWGGDLSGSEVPQLITVDTDKQVTATFQRKNYPLTVTIVGEGTVTETIVPQKTTEYPFETVVQLTPVPSEGWEFVSWGGDLSGSEVPQLITVDTDKQVTATFQLKTYPLNITVEGSGTVSVEPQQEVYTHGTEVTLTPTASEGWEFFQWSGGASGTGVPLVVTVTSELNIVGRFIETLNDGEVRNPVTGRIWMDRNLGASRVATSSTDEQAYGDLYQWGRGADGHEKRNSPTTSTLSSTDQPGHGSFITISSIPYDWRSPQNNNLWQGVNGINNPCPVGYRLPTESEWNAERASWSSNNAAGAFASPLKLPLAGDRSSFSGSLFLVGSSGYYWSSSVSGTSARFLYFGSGAAGMISNYRSFGYSVRCLRD